MCNKCNIKLALSLSSLSKMRCADGLPCISLGFLISSETQKHSALHAGLISHETSHYIQIHINCRLSNSACFLPNCIQDPNMLN